MPSTNDPVSPQTSQRQKAHEEIKAGGNSEFWVSFRQFEVSNIPDAVRLSPGQKFELAFKSTVDPFTCVFAGIGSRISHAENSFPGYGQGAMGYAKRFGASYEDSFDGTMIGNAMLPIVLHQNPRYFRKGMGKVTRRIGYAVLSTFGCNADSGHWQPNLSNLLGKFAAGGISNLYYPAGDRAALRALSKRRDPTVVNEIEPAMYSDKCLVPYTTAAAIVHLEDLRTRHTFEHEQ